MEQLDYNLLFRWFVGLSMDDKVWDHSVLSKNQERFLDSDLAAAFFARILKQAATAGLLSDEHFTVDGTLIEAWVSLKSSAPRTHRLPRAAGATRRWQKRLNRTHASTTDPEARLFKKSKGKEAKLCFMGHVLMENRQSLRALKAVPRVAQNCNGRKSAIDGRTTRHPGYAVSQQLRKRVEEIFGWMKTVGNLRKTRHRGEDRVGWVFTLTAAAYNLVRIRNLQAAVSP